MIQRSNEPLWEALQQEIASRISPHQFDTWFRNVRFRFEGPESVSIQVPNRFHRAFLKNRYLPVIVESIECVTNLSQPRVHFQVDRLVPSEVLEPEPTGSGSSPPIPTSTTKALDPATTRGHRATAGSTGGLPLNPHYTFDEFVVGPSNQLAHAAARSVSDDPGAFYNPLFVYGHVGLGKTHLMQAVAHHYVASGRGRVVYTSCSNFANEFVRAIQKNEIEAFRDRYRSADALFVDDVQFLGAKDRTQEEFFHTFNALYNQQCQILITCDTLPTEIAGLEDRLISRFKLGLVARLTPPDLSTRVAIIMKKATRLGLNLDDDVARVVATRVRNNVREIEGAVMRLHSVVTIENRPLTPESAGDALIDILGEGERLDLPKIQAAVLEEFDVRADDLHSRRRTRSIVLPRQICMYLGRRHTNLSLAEIGRFFGGRDHSTVLHAVEKVQDLAAREPLRSTLQSIERRLGI